MIAAFAIENDFDYLFFIDSDCAIPIDALEKLTGHNKDVVGGMYFQKRFPYWPVIYKQNEKGTFDIITDYPKDALTRVGGIGMGTCLIKVSALKALGYEEVGEGEKKRVVYRAFDPLPATETRRSINGEDLAFCLRCAEKGIEIYADTSVKSNHYTTGPVTEQAFTAAYKIIKEAQEKAPKTDEIHSEV